jgi:hypothetical protein
MPENWDPAVYWDRAKQWRERAASLPEDHPNRAIWLQIAESYEKLAALLQNTKHLPSSRPDR